MRTHCFIRGLAICLLAGAVFSLPACQSMPKSRVAALTGEVERQPSEKKLRLHRSPRGQPSYRLEDR